ncbi:sel1 repeat family protein, partial [Acinetobacter baumannii]|nr:sel1 repeat family protein [Acinetobacter baumannii]
DGTAQDYKIAVEWYQKAATQGNVNAQFNLGILYAKGLGVSKNYEIAKQWIEKAAEQGHENAKIIITQLAS